MKQQPGKQELMRGKNLVIGFYAHPEYYPPTLNALASLKDSFENISIVHRNNPSFGWAYPSNVTMVANGPEASKKELEEAPALKKVWLFLRFTFLLRREIRRSKPACILLYDSVAVLSYWLIKWSIKKPAVLWYHNHDVLDMGFIRKYSILWWAAKAEHWVFPFLDIFSLPAEERKAFFPMDRLGGLFFFIPNYPSIKVYGASPLQKPGHSLKLLYQGSIGPLHGLEEIIGILDRQIKGSPLKLILKGFVSDSYLKELQAIAEKKGVKDRLIYLGAGGYDTVVRNALSCHVGIGIHRKMDIMNATLGTASNKIYEYAASGLPVLLYDNEHFKQHLDAARWTFFTDCSSSSLIEILERIVSDYATYSSAARQDFIEKFNFEHYFSPVLDRLQAV